MAQLIGGALVFAALIVLLVTDDGTGGAAPAVTDAPPPRAERQAQPIQVLRDDVLSILFANLAIDEQNESKLAPDMLFLMTIDGQNNVSIVNIPSLTRVKMRATDANGSTETTYVTLAEVYRRGNAVGNGVGKLREAVEGLFGGVPITRCALLSDIGLTNLINALGGVFVPDDYYCREVHYNEETQTTSDYPIYPINDQYYASLNSEQAKTYVGIDGTFVSIDDLYCRQVFFHALLWRIVEQEMRFTDIIDVCDGWLYTDFTANDVQRIKNALDANGIQGEWLVEITPLWGEDLLLGGNDGFTPPWGYRLPDAASIKEYVLGTFYELVG